MGYDFSNSLTRPIHHRISHNYIISVFLNTPASFFCFSFFFGSLLDQYLPPCETTFFQIKGYVTSCLRAFPWIRLSQSTFASGSHLPQPWRRRGGFWELCHLAVFGRRFLLAFPQHSEWRAFNGAAATHTHTHTHTQGANPVNSHLHFGLSVVPLCSQQQRNLITPQQNTFHWVPLPLSFPLFLPPSLPPCLSRPFNLISGNVISGCFALSPRHLS